MVIRAIAICIGLFVAMPVSAQTAAPEPAPTSPRVAAPAAPPASESEDPRYTFSRVQDGYLRLDVRTGQVAACSRRQVGWACQVLPDDRIVLESEIARLQSENGALKKELLSRGIALPAGVSAPRPSAKTEDKQRSSESNMQRVMALAGAMWRRLVEMIGNLQRDIMKKS